MAVVDVANLEVFYGKRQALSDVSVSIEGGAVGLLGPNGAGKSTFMKTLLGFVRPRSGRVSLFGLDMPQDTLAIRHRLGYMPEKDLMSPKVSAVSFLCYCGAIFGMSRADAMERAHEVLNYVGMGENRYRNMETYSKGMCQRVKFAQALLHDPQLLLLDEPTNGLDPDGRVEMLNLIRDLAQKRKVTIILSSHLLPDVEYVCDHLVIIDKGRIVEDRTMEAMTDVQEGLFEVRVNDRRDAFLLELERRGFALQSRVDGMFLISKPASVEVKAIFQAAKACGAHVRHLRPVRQRLEDAFLHAIGKK